MTKVAYRVQHVEGRDAPLERLLSHLPGVDVDVLTDRGEPPNPWRCYKACLAKEYVGSHLLILQDDVIPCHGLPRAVELIATGNPETPVILFLGGLPKRTEVLARQALKKKRSYCDLFIGDWFPAVAVLWPRSKAEEALRWVEENPKRLGHPAPRSDDAVLGRWVRYTKQRVRVTVPSLVQHPDDVPSTIHDRDRGGKDRGRVAAHWIGDRDPLSIDWN